jgi:hypothetical protein
VGQKSFGILPTKGPEKKMKLYWELWYEDTMGRRYFELGEPQKTANPTNGFWCRGIYRVQDGKFELIGYQSETTPNETRA